MTGDEEAEAIGKTKSVTIEIDPEGHGLAKYRRGGRDAEHSWMESSCLRGQKI